MTSESPVGLPAETPPLGRSPAPERPLQRKALGLALFLILVASLLNALFGDRGMLGLLEARRELDRLEAEIAGLRAENQRLLEEIRSLKTDPRAVERLAREELGLLKPNEVALIIRRPATAR